MHPSGHSTKSNTRTQSKCGDRMNMGSKLRCQSDSTEFDCLSVVISQLGCVLIGSSSPISRSSSSRITHRFPPSVLAGLAFLILFWIGSATDHSTHILLLPLFTIHCVLCLIICPCNLYSTLNTQ